MKLDSWQSFRHLKLKFEMYIIALLYYFKW